jgi:hypothetical protein
LLVTTVRLFSVNEGWTSSNGFVVNGESSVSKNSNGALDFGEQNDFAEVDRRPQQQQIRALVPLDRSSRWPQSSAEYDGLDDGDPNCKASQTDFENPNLPLAAVTAAESMPMLIEVAEDVEDGGGMKPNAADSIQHPPLSATQADDTERQRLEELMR